MPNVPDDAKQYINAEFSRKLEEIDPPSVDIVIETEGGAANAIAQEITGFDGVTLGSSGAFGGKYVAASVPQGTIPDIARLDGVVNVSYDQTAGVMDPWLQGRDIPLLTRENDPIRNFASDRLYESFTMDDPFGMNARIGRVEVPRFNFAQLPPGDPFETLVTGLDQVAGTGIKGENLIPTSQAVEWIRDEPVTGGAIDPESKVAIIDTGHTPTEPENGMRRPRLRSMVPGEPPLDMMGHGSWCTNMVTGNRAPGVWGTVEGVAPGSTYGHFKALNTFPGFGKTSWILRAMDSALDWGADVISMSLGGKQQGPLSDDPYARFIRENCKENAGDADGAIFVVAAGNSGPGEFTIGSPGVAEKALTVGAWSLTDQAPSRFSSRGPQGAWYREHPNAMTNAKSRYGPDEAVKPDVAAPGGGRENEVKENAGGELLFQSSVGWYDGLMDGIKDNRASMRGTSMATPAVAGLVKRLYDAGIVNTASEIKTVVKRRSHIAAYTDAADTASITHGGKNVAVGFGPVREGLFKA